MNKSSSPHIIIIGAGICGLALAQGLRKAGISFTVFERDAASDFRLQGYRVTINHTGAQSLKRNLTPELWDLFERSCADSDPFKWPPLLNAVDGSIVKGDLFGGGGGAKSAGKDAKDNKGTAGGDDGASEFKRSTDSLGPYSADRTIFRAVLLVGLEENVVYGKGFKQYTITDNRVVAHFTDGTSQEGTLLVGADGLRSPVRLQHVPECYPIDTTGRCIYGKTPLNEEVKEKLHPQGLESFSFAVDNRHETKLSLLMQPIRFSNEVPVEFRDKIPRVENYMFWVLVSNKTTFNIEDERLLKLSNKESAQLALDMTKDWIPSIRALFELQEVSQTSTLRVSSVTSNIPVWTPSANVTLIGDAIHIMSPTSGAGANTALKDSADLCRMIIEEGISAESVGKFEGQMREYAQKQIEMGFYNAKAMWNHPAFEDCEKVDF